jgi:prevent-host-death family protein
MTVVSMTDARHDLSEIANRVIVRGERICIEKNNKPAFALVSIEDVKLLEALEDKFDLEDALESLKEPESISLEELEKKLGI